MARPTEYNETTVSSSKQYLESCTDERVGLHVVVDIPSIEGLARFLGLNKSTLYDWESKYPEFSNVLDDIRNEQATRLLNNGLSGTYNSTITKLMLSKHGYVDKQENETKLQVTGITGMNISHDNRIPDKE